jgi:hypothetical protein
MRNIMMDIGFTIETEKEFEELAAAEVMAALLTRVASLLREWDKDAVGYCDEYEIEEDSE